MDSSPIEACNLSAWQKKYIAAGSIKPEDKNMKLKRLAAAILAAAMIAAVFAGCSSKKPEATETFGAIVGTEDEKYSKYFLGRTGTVGTGHRKKITPGITESAG